MNFNEIPSLSTNPDERPSREPSGDCWLTKQPEKKNVKERFWARMNVSRLFESSSSLNRDPTFLFFFLLAQSHPPDVLSPRVDPDATTASTTMYRTCLQATRKTVDTQRTYIHSTWLFYVHARQIVYRICLAEMADASREWRTGAIQGTKPWMGMVNDLRDPRVPRVDTILFRQGHGGRESFTCKIPRERERERERMVELTKDRADGLLFPRASRVLSRPPRLKR